LVATLKVPYAMEGDEDLSDTYDPTVILTNQYRKMQARNRTGNRLKILRSNIQGWGVFALQPIAKGEMIIEYVGELINPVFADVREQRYNARGIGCYMFRVPDEDEIIDATMTGNMARFINHSCDPNAKTDWIVIGPKKKIVIFATRNVTPGEEITYDYLFDLDEQDLVPCHCGAANCKRWMNA